MADTPLNPKPSPSARGRAGGIKSGALGKKVGGFPVYVWGAGLLLAIGVGLYLRHRSANRGATPTSVAAPIEGGGGGSDGGSDVTTDPGVGNDQLGSILDGISGIAAMIGAGGFFPPNGTTATGVPVATTPGASAPHAPTVQDTTPTYPTYSPQFPAGTITTPPANVGSSPAHTDVSSGGGYGGGFGPGLTPNIGIPAVVHGTFEMLPQPLPNDPVVIDPYHGPSYVEPGANTDPHVYIPPPNTPTLTEPVAAPGGGFFAPGTPATGGGYGNNLPL